MNRAPSGSGLGRLNLVGGDDQVEHIAHPQAPEYDPDLLAAVGVDRPGNSPLL